MLRMLVVDDEIDVCDFVRGFFKERDFEVFVAHNGQDALSVIDLKQPHIVILDMRMPVMDGMSLLKELKKSNSPVKVIMVTAVEDLDKMEEASGFGAVDYITKPLLLEQLERSVFAVAEKIRAGSEETMCQGS